MASTFPGSADNIQNNVANSTAEIQHRCTTTKTTNGFGVA